MVTPEGYIIRSGADINTTALTLMLVRDKTCCELWYQMVCFCYYSTFLFMLLLYNII